MSKKNKTKNSSRTVKSSSQNKKIVPKKKKSKKNDTLALKLPRIAKISTQRKELIENVVTELISPEAIPIVLYLIGKTKVSEFVIADALNMEIHRARNLLYKLFEQNVLSFIRKKDKIKGWYICYWDFNEKILPFLSEKIRQNKVEKLKERLDKESSSTFYMCRNACARMDFEKAMEFNFKCPECGELMNEQNNVRTLEFLKEKITELEKTKS
jgi:transcription initiation factor TFIIE subunit alpha